MLYCVGWIRVPDVPGFSDAAHTPPILAVHDSSGPNPRLVTESNHGLESFACVCPLRADPRPVLLPAT
jgi:hypothetical protein